MITNVEKPGTSGLWAPVPAPIALPDAAASSGRGKKEWMVRMGLPLLLIGLVAVGVTLPDGLTYEARVALFTFGLATILWSATALNAAFVALGAALLLVLLGGRPQEIVYDSLATDVIWLMIGAFMLGEAVEQTSLAERLTNFVVARAGRVGQVFWLLTGVLTLLSFFIPATSGRAAVALPVFNRLSDRLNDRNVTRALALLIPTIVLVSTICTLIGAGSHFIANDLLKQVSGQDISFLNWVIYGLPFGLAASVVSCFVILRMYLTPEQRDRAFDRPTSEPTRRFSPAEWKTILITVGMLLLWMTERLHHVGIALVTMAGALLLTAPGFGVISWKDGLKSVSWSLILFVGASTVLGKALIDTKAAQWIMDGIFSAGQVGSSAPTYVVLGLIALISLSSHIYMTSHTARAAALLPMLLLFAQSLGINPAAMVFIATVGMDYCLTFPVSSKALLMFQGLDRATFHPRDLLRLSAVLLVVHLLLIVVFYYSYWQFVGLAL